MCGFITIVMNPINLQFQDRNKMIMRRKSVSFGGQATIEKLAQDAFVGARNFLIQETAFFREPETLEFVKKYIVNFMKDKPEINIIDGACSKGYETYSLAMLLDKIGKKVNITGFDIGVQAISDAKKGKFIVETVKGNDSLSNTYKMGYSSFDDDYLAFSKDSSLTAKQLEYKCKFRDFFDEIPWKENISFLRRIHRFIFKSLIPDIATKQFQVKPEKSGVCNFIQGDILKLDEIVPKHSADVLLFRNALYHLTTIEGESAKLPLLDEMIVPTVKNVVAQVNKALSKDGLFVIGEHPNDHTLTTGKVLYKELEAHKFTPVYKNHNGAYSVIWKKN